MAPTINTFVYDACFEQDVKVPDIPAFARRYFGQCAEDLIVVALLRALATREGLDLTRERYLEIGANHPIATSASYLAHVELGMTGSLIEANRLLIDPLAKVRPHDKIRHLAITVSDEPFVELHVSNQNELSSLSRRFVEEWRDGAVGIARVDKVPAMRVNQLLKEDFPDCAPLFLSCDIEGLDLDVLKDLDWQQWRPAIVQVEPSDHFLRGNSQEIRSFLESQGYVIIAVTDVNLIAMDRARLQPSAESTEPKPQYDVQERLRGLEAAHSRLLSDHAALTNALPARLRSRDFLLALQSGAVKWHKLALSRPWNITIWQTARRLQKRPHDRVKF